MNVIVISGCLDSIRSSGSGIESRGSQRNEDLDGPVEEDMIGRGGSPFRLDITEVACGFDFPKVLMVSP